MRYSSFSVLVMGDAYVLGNSSWVLLVSTRIGPEEGTLPWTTGLGLESAWVSQLVL